MHLEIVSPEAVLFSSTVDSISVPGTDGEFQMLNKQAENSIFDDSCNCI